MWGCAGAARCLTHLALSRITGRSAERRIPMSIALIQFEEYPALHIVAGSQRVILDLRDDKINVLIELVSRVEVEELADACQRYLANKPAVFVPTFA